MKCGNLDFTPVEEDFDLVANSTKQAIQENNLKDVLVSEIDPTLADTAAFCEQYAIGLDIFPLTA